MEEDQTSQIPINTIRTCYLFLYLVLVLHGSFRQGPPPIIFTYTPALLNASSLKANVRDSGGGSASAQDKKDEVCNIFHKKDCAWRQASAGNWSLDEIAHNLISSSPLPPSGSFPSSSFGIFSATAAFSSSTSLSFHRYHILDLLLQIQHAFDDMNRNS